MGDETDVERLLTAANEASGQARNSWITFILFGTYLAVAVGATTHKQILLEAPTKLPLLGVDLPLVDFYRVSPWLFVLMHLYVMVQLYLLSRTLHLFDDALCATQKVFSDRERIRAQLSKFVVTQLLVGGIAEYLPRMFLRLAAWITLLAAPIVLLLAFQVRFLPYHDVATTWIHRLALIADIVVCWMLWPAIVHRSGRLRDAALSLVLRIVNYRQTVAAVYRTITAFWQKVRGGGWLGALLPTVATLRAAQRDAETMMQQLIRLGIMAVTCGGAIVFSLFVATVPDEAMERFVLQDFGLTTIAKRTIDNRCLKAIDGLSAAEKRVSCILDPALWTLALFKENAPVGHGRVWLPTWLLFEGDPDPVRSQAQSPFARNLVLIDADLIAFDPDKLAKAERTISLRGRDLRYANLTRADLRKVDLTGADLRGAILLGTRLQEAKLDNAKAQGARLEFAQLQGASLRDARLQGALLVRARLQGASLDFAELQGASLGHAQLQGASLGHAQLQGASLDGAILQGASLLYAKLQGAALNEAQLQGASLNETQLQGASLQRAQLQGASLDFAELQGASLRYARLQGSDLRSSNLWRAIRPEAAFLRTTDGRGLTTDAPTGGRIDELVRSATESVPDGPQKVDALKRLEVLSRAMDTFDEKRSQAFWLRLRDRGWDETKDDPPLADDLGRLGCGTDGAPYVARGLLRRMELDLRADARRPYPGLLAQRLLDPGCAGAAALTDAEKSKLREIADEPGAKAAR